jgi:alpha-ketoglutarate-dependent taurine dioxygenase
MAGFAAEICGLDLQQPLSVEVKSELHRALVEFEVLLIPPQAVTPERHIDLASGFGKVASDTQGRWPRGRHSDGPRGRGRFKIGVSPAMLVELSRVNARSFLEVRRRTDGTSSRPAQGTGRLMRAQ